MWDKAESIAKFLPGPFFPVARRARDAVLWPITFRLNRIRREIAKNPTDPSLHHRLGEIVLRSPPLPPLGPALAAAHFRTSLAFAPDFVASGLGLAWAYLKLGLYDLASYQFEAVVGQSPHGSRFHESATAGLGRISTARALGRRPWRVECLETTIYLRYRTVVQECLKHGVRDKTLLDVGGGNGTLCLFLPESRYVLADLVTNGISATPLPFPDASFDVAVTIDTLEHIPLKDRALFISELIRVSREAVLLMAPFSPSDDELAFDPCIMRVYPNPWTGEHMKNGLPTLSWLESCLSSLGVEFTLKPFASISSYFPLLLVQLLLVERFDYQRLAQVSEFYNTRYVEAAHEYPPVGYLVNIAVQKVRKAESGTSYPARRDRDSK